MINKVNNNKNTKYLVNTGPVALSEEVISILGNNEYVIEVTEDTGDIYFRLFFLHDGRYWVRYTGYSHDSCLEYLPRRPHNASKISYNDIVSLSRRVHAGTHKLYKYPQDTSLQENLKDFK